MSTISFSCSLPVVITREDDVFVAYTPALELATQGDSLEETRKNFGEIVQIFIQDVIERGVIDEVLGGLGWQKRDNQWVPPAVIEHSLERFSFPIEV